MYLTSFFCVQCFFFFLECGQCSRPDGFGGGFHHELWDVIKIDVFNCVPQFFKNSWLYLNSNMKVLISKFPNADRIEDYRLIALVNFQFKIITKFLVDRLAQISSNVISEQQRGFIKGRQITVCIGIASKAVTLLDSKAFGGNVALKYDIRKAFHKIDQGFLLQVLNAFGFDSTFCNWVKNVLHSANFPS